MAKRKRRSKKPGRRVVRTTRGPDRPGRAKSDDGRKADHQERPGPPGKRAGEKKAGENKADKAKDLSGQAVPGKKPKSAARNLVETVVVVAVLVLGIRFFLLEAFKIPSSSMEPTLIGHPYHGDRVLAWKPSVWTTGERWSVNVFVKHPERRLRVWCPYDGCKAQFQTTIPAGRTRFSCPSCGGEIDIRRGDVRHEPLRGDDGDKNYIKRLIGLPGERVLIAGGDIYIQAPGSSEAEIARKPPATQEDVWHLVYEGTELARSWELGDGLSVVAGAGGSGEVIRGEAQGRTFARFARNHYDDDKGLATNLYVKRLRVRVRCPEQSCGHEFKAYIRTGRTRFPCPSCGREIDLLRDEALCDAALGGKPPWYPTTPHEEVAVGDLRVSFDVFHEAVPERDLEPGRGLVLAKLARDDEVWLARVPFGGGEAHVSGHHGVDKTARVPAPERAGRRRVAFAHVDQAVVLAVDGEEIIRERYDLSWTERAGTPETNEVCIGLEGASLSFANLRIERDLHYLPRGSDSVVEFYWAGWHAWRAKPLEGVPNMQPDVGRAPAVRSRDRLGEHECFFMGDNSPSSYDSRMWGAVDKRMYIWLPILGQLGEGDLVGRAFFAFWPPHQMGWMH